jgi:nucleoside-diphosphate-sugar epimerase
LKILITGICGFVGSVLARTLAATKPDWQILGHRQLDATWQ